MKQRSILFSAPMVRALLAGAKTQTRRILSPQPEHLQYHEWKGKVLYDAEHRIWWWKKHSFENLIDFEYGRAELAALCPYGQAGDRLWVRESWNAIRPHRDGEVDVASSIPKGRGSWSVVYAATDSQRDEHRDDRGFGWRPGIHMPRWASRIELEVVEVRVQRLHDITEQDAAAEGVTPFPKDPEGDCWTDGKHRTAFEYLWNEIHGWNPPAWSANPWLWCITFKRIPEAA